MKVNILLSFLLIFSVFLISLNTHELVDYINNLHTTWRAKPYERDIRPLLGTYRSLPLNKYPFKKFEKRNDLPENFDLREAFPNCESIKEIRDQSNCGSCWAFGAAEAMSDRLCIHSNSTIQTRVSAIHLVSCCSDCGNGCNGGWPIAAFEFWETFGIPSGGLYNTTDTCKPYPFPPCKHGNGCEGLQDTPECTDTCISEYPIPLEKDLTFGVSTYYAKGEENIMQEIFENGSVEGAFDVYEDFRVYSEGIYQHKTGGFLGGHAIKIIGWGVENDVKFWIVANSWNEDWGEKGFFRILRGSDECGIEDYVAAGMPKIE